MGSVNFAEEGMTFVLSCLKEYGGQTCMLGFFLAGFLYVLLCGSRKERYFFCGITGFLAVTIYNPLLANPVIKFMNMSAEYYRFFWILPMGFLTAWMCVKMAETQKTKGKKAALICLLFVILAAAGNPVISTFADLQVPQNKYKVPDELLAVCEIIHQDSGDNAFPKSVFEYEYNTYVRQYDGNMRLTLDRDVYLLALGSNTVSTRNLSQEEVDAQRRIIDVIQYQNVSEDPSVLTAALKATQTDYLVISKSSEPVLAYLTSAGCESFADTGSHIIFRGP